MLTTMAKIKVLDLEISVVQDEYISLTDIANSKDGDSRAADIIKNWMRNRGTLEFIGTWEQIHNVNFKVVEFDHFIHENIPQDLRIKKLNEVAIKQMSILLSDSAMKQLEDK